MQNFILFFVLSSTFLFTQCKSVDLRTKDFKKEGVNNHNSQKGKAILEKVVKAQNLEALKTIETYQLMASDYWYKKMGMNMNPWEGENGALLDFKLVFNSFDSKVGWINGKRKGMAYGIQSWQLYTQDSSGKIEKTTHKKMEFMLPTMQYFMELPYRMLNAPIISYMGTEEMNGEEYELVFVSWDSAEPNEHDQYVLYINKQTSLLERATYTIRDNFMWMPKSFYGTAVYRNFENINGIIIPMQMDVFMMDKINSKPVHTFSIKKVIFNSFEKYELYPFKDLPEMGDAK